MSQEDLCEMFGFNSRQIVSSIETGSRKMSADELVRATEIFDVPLDYFTDPFRLDGEDVRWTFTGSRELTAKDFGL